MRWAVSDEGGTRGGRLAMDEQGKGRRKCAYRRDEKFKQENFYN